MHLKYIKLVILKILLYWDYAISNFPSKSQDTPQQNYFPQQYEPPTNIKVSDPPAIILLKFLPLSSKLEGGVCMPYMLHLKIVPIAKKLQKLWHCNAYGQFDGI